MEGLTQHFAERLEVPGASAAAEVLVDSCSSTTAMSGGMVQGLGRQPGIAQNALTQAFVEHARVVTTLGQECDTKTQ